MVEACDVSIKHGLVGWFGPDYKRIIEPYDQLAGILAPVKETASRSDKLIKVRGGGKIEFWTLEDENAGRSREYDLAIIDEAAFAKKNMGDVWRKAIRPTLLTRRGRALVASNTNGVDTDNWFWQICNDPDAGFWDEEDGFHEYHAPSNKSPYVPVEDFENLRKTEHPLVFEQEYLAKFVDWSGIAFFDKERWMVDGLPVAYPTICDAVYATIDTATKTGRDNDGTAVTFWAISKFGGGSHPLVVLDWDLIQIPGDLLETWLPTIFQRLEDLAITCRARRGSLGAWIEDKSSGMVLLQQCARRGMPAKAIDSKLTSVGKSERAISVSGYHYRGDVKVSQVAWDKVVTYKSVTKNHFQSQVLGFRVGEKDQVDDDLLDTYTYGLAIGLGNDEGY